jgi:hypothetical protein
VIAAADNAARLSTFASLRHAGFRALSAGYATSQTGAQMELFAVGWLAVVLAGREGAPQLAALYLGLLGLARAVPGLGFGLVGGVLADYLDRRMLFIWTQIVQACAAAALGVVALSGWGGIGALMALVFIGSTAGALEMPAAQASLPRLVPHDDLMSAVGLTNAMVNVAMFAGPLVGGLLLGPLGIPGVLGLEALLHALAIAAVVRVAPMRPSVRAGLPGGFGALLDGLAYVARDGLLRWLMLLAVLAALFGRAVAYVLPAVATNVLHVGALELSWLLAARGLGTLAGSLAIASLASVHRQRTVLAGSAVVFGAVTGAFALQRAFVPALALAAGMGLAQFAFAGLAVGGITIQTPDHLRGRALSYYLTTVSGFTPLGVLLLGTTGSLLGIDVAIGAGALILLAGGVAALAVPSRLAHKDAAAAT